MITAIILAAGQGTRMKSALPKVLHPLAGRPLVHYSVRAALEAGCDRVVIVLGHGRESVETYLTGAFGDRVTFAVQREQRGTGDAARAGIEGMEGGRALVFYADAPLIRAEDLLAVIEARGDLALATIEVADPSGYGRVLRDADGSVREIREDRDLRSDEERAVREINPGVYAADVGFLKEVLAALEPWGAKKELYLTDIVAAARRRGLSVTSVTSHPLVLVGINDRQQLFEAEQRMHARIAERWRREGVTVRDGARIDDPVTIGADAIIETGAVLRGETRIGAGALVDVGCVLDDVVVAEDATLKPYSVLARSTVGVRAQIGPFSHVRPESQIGEEAHIGNFVETKKTRVGKGSKANHLAYLGDGVIGEGANIGAGTIFCNYDGFRKHTTTIEDGAFIGSDSQLVAPVTIGKNAYVATGTTVTLDVPEDALAVGRARQENKLGYASRLRAKLKSQG